MGYFWNLFLLQLMLLLTTNSQASESSASGDDPLQTVPRNSQVSESSASGDDLLQIVPPIIQVSEISASGDDLLLTVPRNSQVSEISASGDDPLQTVPRNSQVSEISASGDDPLQTVPVDPCAGLHCTKDEKCGENNGVYGCFCNEGYNSTDFDYEETCFSSSGTMSLSRCQLFEAGYPSNILHLNDINCPGSVEDGRVVFHFDNDGNTCGTAIISNGTHLIYQNTIYGETSPHTNIISRERRLVLQFYCAYPVEKSLSMPIGIHPVESILTRMLPSGIGEYQVRMRPFLSPDYKIPVTSSTLDLPLNQRLYVAVEVIGMDKRQISTVIDSCWATPINDPSYPIRWDLIIHECPNREDGTVVIIENGMSTTSRFSFNVFAFNNNASMVYLHCQIHLCIKAQCDCTTSCYPRHNARRPRSIEVKDTASISMPLNVHSTNSAPHFASSLLLPALAALIAAAVR